MSIIGWIVLGLLVGLIAKAIMPGGERGGIIITTLLGIAGALVGGFLAAALGIGDPIDEFFDLSTWIAAVIGALIILFIWNAISRRRSSVSGGCPTSGILPPPALPARLAPVRAAYSALECTGSAWRQKEA